MVNIRTKSILCLIDGLAQGGAERQLLGLTKGLQDLGKYRVMSMYYCNSHFYRKLADALGISIQYVDNKNKTRIGKIFNVIKTISLNSPDVIISYKRGANMMGVLYKILHPSVKLIVSERCSVKKFNFYNKLSFWSYRFADVIVPNSYDQERIIAERYPKYKKKINVITNFTDIEYFCFTQKTKAKEFLVVGRIMPQKNVIPFMEVVKELKERHHTFHITWVGGKENPDYYKTCMEKYEESDIKDVLTFAGSSTNVKYYYQKCDIFCLPSLFEGYPNVVCEAMSCGMPVICSDVCDNKLIVSNNINGFLFDPNDNQDMIRTFERMLFLTGDNIKTMSLESRKFAEEKFGMKSFINKYIQINDSLKI